MHYWNIDVQQSIFVTSIIHLIATTGFKLEFRFDKNGEEITKRKIEWKRSKWTEKKVVKNVVFLLQIHAMWCDSKGKEICYTKKVISFSFNIPLSSVVVEVVRSQTLEIFEPFFQLILGIAFSSQCKSWNCGIYDAEIFFEVFVLRLGSK